MRRPLLAIAAVLGLAILGPMGHAWAQNPSFNLVNRGTAPIRALFFTPAGDERWGQNRLQGRTIAPGASYSARRRLDGNCVFDIRVVFSDGRTEDRRGLDTCRIEDIAFGAGPAAAAGAARKAADDPSFKLINRGSQPIASLFVVPAGQGSGAGWGVGRLGGPLQAQTDEVVHPGKTGQCRWDLKLVLADGTAKEKHGIDLCRVTDLPFP